MTTFASRGILKWRRHLPRPACGRWSSRGWSPRAPASRRTAWRESGSPSPWTPTGWPNHFQQCPSAPPNPVGDADHVGQTPEVLVYVARTGAGSIPVSRSRFPSTAASPCPPAHPKPHQSPAAFPEDDTSVAGASQVPGRAGVCVDGRRGSVWEDFPWDVHRQGQRRPRAKLSGKSPGRYLGSGYLRHGCGMGVEFAMHSPLTTSKPQTPNPEPRPRTPDSRPQTPASKPPDPRSQIPDPQFQTPNLQPQTLNPKP